MTYFQHITSLADLKKQYRQLALANHPDKGGDTAIMQAINTEFEKLFDQWKDRKEVDYNGYENDYTEARTSRQYTDYVWNEYKWRGSRYDHDLHKNDLAEKFREFVKQAYPHCKFSIRSGWAGYTYTFNIALIQADFEAFAEEYRKGGDKGYCQINHYHLEHETRLTDRCKEVMRNVIDFCESFNYDNSDSMTDYFDVNFYATYEIGTSRKYFTYMPHQLKSAAPTYKRKPTPTERAIQQAIGAGNIIADHKAWTGNPSEYVNTGRLVLMKDDDLSKEMGYPIFYSQPSLLKKRLEAMRAVGIICDNFDKVKNKRSSAIWVEGYTPELQAKLDKERAEEDAREREFNAKRSTSTPQAEQPKKQEQPISGHFEIIDYSEKAIALIGDTKRISDKLKELGGRFNPKLSCGAGWIFSKRKEQELRNLLNLAA